MPQSLSARQLLLKAESEEQFLMRVKQWAVSNGWLFYHTRRSERSDAGFFDVYALHERMGRILHAELKTERGQPTAEQAEWGETLCRIVDLWAKTWPLATLPEYYLWRPSDWDEIEYTFRRRTDR